MKAAGAASGTMSVVIPCHNYGRFLPEALESIDRQTHRPDEIIVCDDASTDDSWEIIRREAAARPDLVVLRNETNQGLIQTFNRLVEASTGDIVVTLSADDRLGTRYLEGTRSAILDNGWDFAYCRYLSFGAEEGEFDPPEFDPVLLLRVNYIAGTSAFRRELFDRVGGYNPAFESCGLEDWDFWLSAIEAGFSGGKAEVGDFHWRRHENGSRNTIGRRQRMALRWKLLRHHPRFYLHSRTLRYLARFARGGLTNVG